MLMFQILTSKGLDKWATSHILLYEIHIVFSRPVLRLKPPGLILLNTTQNDLPFPVLCDQHTLTNKQQEMPLIDPSFWCSHFLEPWSRLSSAVTIMNTILNTVRTCERSFFLTVLELNHALPGNLSLINILIREHVNWFCLLS